MRKERKKSRGQRKKNGERRKERTGTMRKKEW